MDDSSLLQTLTAQPGFRVKRKAWGRIFRTEVFFWILIILIAVEPLLAGEGLPWTPRMRADEKPRELQDVGVTEHLGTQLNLDLKFKNEQGEQVSLSQYFHGRPVLMAIVYYSCPNICNLQLNGFLADLKAHEWTIGREFQFVLVSMEPKEAPEQARIKKAEFLASYGRPGAEKGWHFLTGNSESIGAIAGQVGFRYRWDEAGQQWAHQAAAYFISPKGKLTRYLYGIQLPPADFRLAMLEASDGKIGDVIDKVVMFCFKYDPSRRTYAFYAWNFMRGAGALTLFVLGVFLFRFWNRERRKKREQPRAMKVQET